ncbi:MAG: formate transporter FocA [Phycisphaerales bacterium]|nr:formate transporter FocA [Phycisphaerales bacterium]
MDGVHPFDALMPRQIAAKAEDAGVTKARLDLLSMLLLAVLAGAFISLGALFSTVAIAGASGVLPYGITRLLAGLTFSLGLVLVVIAGAELFTGNNLLVIAFASRKVTLRQVLRNWLVVYTGNFIGSAATALGVHLSGIYGNSGGQVGRAALAIAQSKCHLTFDEAFVRGIYCNALVCLAVWLCMSCRSTGEKIGAIIFPVTAFVAAGFEHSVANMYFIPAALCVKWWAPAEFWTSAGLTQSDFSAVNTGNFLLHNLLPVTLGNIIGGVLFVGAVYWVIYIRRRPVIEAAPAEHLHPAQHPHPTTHPHHTEPTHRP